VGGERDTQKKMYDKYRGMQKVLHRHTHSHTHTHTDLLTYTAPYDLDANLYDVTCHI